MQQRQLLDHKGVMNECNKVRGSCVRDRIEL